MLCKKRPRTIYHINILTWFWGFRAKIAMLEYWYIERGLLIPLKKYSKPHPQNNILVLLRAQQFSDILFWMVLVLGSNDNDTEFNSES